jgi:phage terminase large subunit-like protein
MENIDIAYVEEAHNVSEESWDLLTPTIRADRSEIWAVFNPRYETDATYQKFIVSPPDDIQIVKINYTDNPFCPAVMIQEAEELKRKNPAKYREVWLGECRTMNENALWKRDTMINPFRVKSAPADLDRIVIAVDPAVTNKDKSDHTGIVIAGRKKIAGEIHYYILDDRSLIGSPSVWANTAINAYREYSADRIVAETNQGGDMVEQTLRNISRSIAYRGVRATRGKIVRAEPCAELYERGLVHHVGVFPELEDEMCDYCGFDKEKSPDRMDALVWALTDLSNSGSGSAPILAS